MHDLDTIRIERLQRPIRTQISKTQVFLPFWQQFARFHGEMQDMLTTFSDNSALPPRALLALAP